MDTKESRENTFINLEALKMIVRATCLDTRKSSVQAGYDIWNGVEEYIELKKKERGGT